MGAAANALAVGSFGFWVIYSWLPWILECSKKAPGCSVSLSNRLKMQSKKADCIFTMKTPQVLSYVIAGCVPVWHCPHNYCALLSLLGYIHRQGDGYHAFHLWEVPNLTNGALTKTASLGFHLSFHPWPKPQRSHHFLYQAPYRWTATSAIVIVLVAISDYTCST